MAIPPVAHNHHYVPQFLIRNFTDQDGKVWVYDTVTKRITSRSPKSAASKTDFYAWTKGDGSTDYETIENYFSRIIENDAAVAIRRLLNHEILEPEEIVSFFRFVAAQLCRTPASFARVHDAIAPIIQEMIDRIAKFDADFRDRVYARLFKIGISPDEIEKFLTMLASGGATAKPAREFVMHQSLALIEAVTEDFCHMSWCFHDVRSGDPDLVIGDHPVSLFDADPVSNGQKPFGIRSPFVEITLPLSSRMLACARWNGPISYGELEPGAGEVANNRTLRSAHRYVMAPFRSNDLMNRAAEAKIHAPKQHVHRIKVGERLTIATAFY